MKIMRAWHHIDARLLSRTLILRPPGRPINRCARIIARSVAAAEPPAAPINHL